MAYIPDPTDATQPEDEVDASTAAAEFRALKTYILGLVAPSAILKNPKRQTVVSASVNTNGQPNFLSVGTGLNFNIDGSTVPVVMTFADGYDVNGAVDNNSRIVSNLTNQGTLSANLVNYLAATFVDSSSVTYSAHLLPPQYGPVFDRNRNVLLQFENNILDDYGNTWTAPAGNSFVSGGSQKFGTYALNLNGTSQYLRNTEFNSLPQGSWEIKGWYNFTGLPGSGAVQTLLDASNTAGLGVKLDIVNTAGVTKLRLYASSNGTTNDIANAVLGANTTWATGTWYEVRIIFDALTNNYRVYLSIAGAAETQDISVASSARICPLNRITIGANNAAAQFFNGSVDCFHLSACARAAAVVVPSTSADEIDGHWFDSTAYKMFEITGASTAAGDNPEMTAVNRLFFGEANASTITVSSITAYAINGKYDSGYFEVASLNTSYSKSHNIGTSAIKVDWGFSQYSDGTGWHIFGQRGNYSGTAGQYQGTPVVRADTKNITLRSGSTFILGVFLDENGVAVNPTTAYARVVVERNF